MPVTDTLVHYVTKVECDSEAVTFSVFANSGSSNKVVICTYNEIKQCFVFCCCFFSQKSSTGRPPNDRRNQHIKHCSISSVSSIYTIKYSYCIL